MLQLLLPVNKFDDDGLILLEFPNLEAMRPSVGSKARHPAERSRSCEAVLPRFQEKPLVKGLAFTSVTLTCEDSKNAAFLR